jgi:hypothetical protein
LQRAIDGDDRDSKPFADLNGALRETQAGIVIMIVARTREVKVHRIDHTLIIGCCVLFRFKGNGPFDASIRPDFGSVVYR